ncbi:hypothetical protein EOD41_03025 [Mucilaginibacter limnophilus]|uniref:Uncharacterized protein n=1 Tax=Mucilaginibacter limnophilus TaxID=1932778 RepID=A0A3S2V449_9SPHI|nr:hypothetical protein [Mucilaginibacter limnophilus]RVU02925.1 hypothetical protein EOD41_03025 [Mucilaginibacter limnophilus]
MNTKLITIACAVFVLTMNCATAQDNITDNQSLTLDKQTKIYNILALDGENVKVNVTSDYVKHVLKLSFLNDTISIREFWGVPPEVKLLNSTFLELKYEVRGGSNLGMGKLLILCVKNGRLIEAMHVLRYSDWDDGAYKKAYNVKSSLKVDSKNNYSIVAEICDYVISKQHPEENYIFNNTTILNFDKKNSVFYSAKQNLNNKVITTNSQSTIKKKINGYFPVIILGKEDYYFINNWWYQADKKTK